MKDKYKILIIASEKNYTVDAINLDNIDISYSYTKINIKILRIIRRLWAIMHFPFYDIWFNFNNASIQKYDLIILFETIYPDKIIKYIRKKNKHCRIIYWLWNTIDRNIETKFNIETKLFSPRMQTLDLLARKDLFKCEIWSFDKKDCNKYKLNYNNQVSYKINTNMNTKIKYDFIFCGQDKTRLKIIKELKDKLFKYKFKILLIPDKHGLYTKDDQQYFLKEHVPYPKLIEMISCSKCIIDITQSGQHGITWRPLEALFYKKKLLTNFEEIISYDFYDKDNIFILGKDDLNQIDIFLNTPYKEIPSEIINSYLAKGWLNNFMKERPD